MPNWVSNTVTPLNEAAVSFTRERIVDEKGEFCFSRLVPLPRELSKTSSPNRIVSPEEMQAFKERYAERVCTEYEQEGLLYVEHPSGFIESCCTAECARNLINRFGAADWYTFTNSHWGCKWDPAFSVHSVPAVCDSISWGQALFCWARWSPSGCVISHPYPCPTWWAYSAEPQPTLRHSALPSRH